MKVAQTAVGMMLTNLQIGLEAMGLTVHRDVPLGDYTSFRIGGPADLLVVVHTVDDLAGAVALAHKSGMPWWVLGGGSNVLISDAGVRGLTIVNRCRAIRIGEDGTVWAESGALLAGLAREAIQAGLAGLEWAVSVPGTVGGAVVGNAGAHGGCIADCLSSVELVHPSGQRFVWPAAELELGYRSSRLKTGALTGVVLSASFRLTPAPVDTLRQRASEYLAYRRRTQPITASAGSIFRNPPGDYAGRLIEAAGLKGAREGGAQFSTVHANFIINLGGATARDVLCLIERAQRAVKERFGVTLEPEILFIGL
ncbi:MAG: UDP-N-acetylmuramate dehydrogenase [Anaerolineae bacterium]|nr:UDP-N-acetylmuramate dehydrogenase [Anaerolineae bacterium]MDW8100960.1 UDP-N-acetylmuramate dehydrogenase [Anaerolineae bacterium]